MKSVAPSRLELLLLCDAEPGVENTIRDHVVALQRQSRHSIHPLSFRKRLPRTLDFRRFDAVVLHYSVLARSPDYLDDRARGALREFGGLKAAFIQDEYASIDANVAAFRDLGVRLLFTCMPPDLADVVYSDARLPGVVKATVLTGYVPLELTTHPVLPYDARPIDIGYRARRVPAWLGSLGLEKHVIAERVAADAPRYGLRHDISTRIEDRIYGADWTAFIARCKAMLGTESGSSVLDFTGRIQDDVESHRLERPDASFEELRDRYFRDEDGARVLHVISPRIFEAAALRTLMILYEGDYSGRVEPWRHYVPLRKDHGNMDEVVAVLRDSRRAQDIIERAYTEVALNPDNSFAAMVREFDSLVDAGFVATMRRRRGPYSSAAFRRVQFRARFDRRFRKTRYALVRELVPVLDRVLRVFPGTVQRRVRRLLSAVDGSMADAGRAGRSGP